MPLVTLTTDFGLNDHYIGALKGDLMHLIPQVQIVDINNEIPAFDLLKAAFILRNAATKFPSGTFHFININMKDGNNRYLIVQRNDSYYVCPDNGIICLIFPDEKFKAYVMADLPEHFTHEHVYRGLATVVNQLSDGQSIETLAKETTSYLVLRHMQPIVNEDMVTGSVFYIDQFNNVIINITKEMFEQVIGNKPFTLEFRNYKIHKISKHYNEVPEGEFLCLFNDAGYLEIAINKGNASGLLGMEFGSNVILEARNIPQSNALGINDH